MVPETDEQKQSYDNAGPAARNPACGVGTAQGETVVHEQDAISVTSDPLRNR